MWFNNYIKLHNVQLFFIRINFNQKNSIFIIFNQKNYIFDFLYLKIPIELKKILVYEGRIDFINYAI